jgi:hypothetical protein
VARGLTGAELAATPPVAAGAAAGAVAAQKMPPGLSRPTQSVDPVSSQHE